MNDTEQPDEEIGGGLQRKSERRPKLAVIFSRIKEDLFPVGNVDSHRCFPMQGHRCAQGIADLVSRWSNAFVLSKRGAQARPH